MLTYPWKCTVLHCNHLGNTWKPLVLMTRHYDYCPSPRSADDPALIIARALAVLMTRHFDYCLSASEGDNQSVRSSTPVVSRCFTGGYNVKLNISRGRVAWWLLAFLHSGGSWPKLVCLYIFDLIKCNINHMSNYHRQKSLFSYIYFIYLFNVLSKSNLERLHTPSLN